MVATRGTQATPSVRNETLEPIEEASPSLSAPPASLGPDEPTTAQRLAGMKARLEEERELYKTMCATLELYKEMYGEDIRNYPEDVQQFAARQARNQKRSRPPSFSDESDLEVLPQVEESQHLCITPRSRPRGRVKDPKTYSGKSTKELNDFLASLRMAFRYQPAQFPTEETKVAFAAQYLEGLPMKEWDTRVQDQEAEVGRMSFADFEGFLRNLIIDPANRQRLALMSYSRAIQKEGQSIRRFVSYLEELEHEMEPYTETQKANHLLAKINPTIRHKLIEQGYHNQQWHREELVNTIAMLETNEAWIKAPRSRSDREESRPTRNQARRHWGTDKDVDIYTPDSENKSEPQRERKLWQGTQKGDQRPARPPRSTGGAKNRECHNCGKVGHYAASCYAKKKTTGISKINTQTPPREQL